MSKRSLGIWVDGARPRTLPAAIAPVLVATALARESFNPLTALLALVVSLSLQIGVNYANDYSDGIRGTDNDRIGPSRITAGGLAKPVQVKSAAFISFAVAAVAGLGLAITTSWWLIAVGAISIAAAWGYTGGKNPYGYIGLGELFVFIFFGLVATVGSFYVQVNEITGQSILAGTIVGSLACAILVINNVRDRAKDEVVGKRTLAVRLGDKNSRILYSFLVTTPYLLTAGFASPWTLLTLLTLPMTISILKALWSGIQGAELIALLGKTGKLQMFFSLALSLALII
ncbi:MAG: 1,4-dihydroxy-2-naphthoate polyprenyltransferase [Candidatus Planktophila sp.]|jgi:1,4-dihydroxy-2-naphthoate octaprenyltransferase|nr:1,4-dihydroxy-2-naphthoate polyprenyltransferase [Candidatus Planktophila sp.]